MIRQLGTRNAKSKAILEYLMDAASFSPNSYRNLNVAVSRFLRGDRAPLLELTAPYGPNQGSPSYFSVGRLASRQALVPPASEVAFS